MFSIKRSLLFLYLAFCIPSLFFAQRPPKLIEAKPQPAQKITLRLSAELATALETLRLNTREPAKTDENGVTTQTPMYPNLQLLVEAALRGQGGFFRQVLNKYPGGSVKVSQDAAAKAKQEADAAAEKALK